jgi:cytochrome c biogenesis protein CcdA
MDQHLFVDGLCDCVVVQLEEVILQQQMLMGMGLGLIAVFSPCLEHQKQEH